jgi:Oxaloacetate decarboxylase, gamma chain.
MELLTVNWTNTFVIVGFGFAMVLIILTLLVFLLQLFEKTMSVVESRKNKPNKVVSAKINIEEMTHGGDVCEEDLVAISAAVFLYFDEVHDNESNVIKIKRVQRRYSPWNSKIYGVTPLN